MRVKCPYVFTTRADLPIPFGFYSIVSIQSFYDTTRKHPISLPFPFAVPPKIAPFTVGADALFPGDYFTIQCSIVHGDMPLTMQWSFNGAPIKAGAAGDVTVARMGARSSVLTIESVRGVHAGNYTCLGQNEAGTAEHRVQLIVNG